ncbi:MAG: gliding motility-associated C-terminal domain-containing protein [Saprospiraceae bacterium]|nr:gliding motility-associated C-terminal domain-containing protein [Lewinella sp.]
MRIYNLSYRNILRRLLLVSALAGSLYTLRAEGVKQLVANPPANGLTPPVMLLAHDADFGNFATPGTDASSRLYVTLANVNETINLGLSLPYNDFGQVIANGKYIVHFRSVNDPAIDVTFTVDNTTRNVTTFSEAEFGGYLNNNFTYTPGAAGDYYIEFEIPNDSNIPNSPGTNTQKLHIGYWDIAVTDNNDNNIDGRVWSRNWAFRTPPADPNNLDAEECIWNRSFEGKIFSYTDDGFVTSIDFADSGFKGLSFNVSLNNTGPGNSGDLEEDRKSTVGPPVNVSGGYRVFLNLPDENVFPSDDACGNLEAANSFSCEGDELCFPVSIDGIGQVEMIIDLDLDSEYTPDSRDRILVFQFDNVSTVLDTCLAWDGLDANGDAVPSGVAFNVVFIYTQGVQHYAAYDVEILSNGFCVNTERPAQPDCSSDLATNLLYWDDTQLPANISSGTGLPADGRLGCACQTAGCRTWTNFDTDVSSCTLINDGVRELLNANPSGYGDGNTLNTWWYARAQKVIRNVILLACTVEAQNTAICANDNTTLAVNVVGGQSPYTFSWSGPNGFAASTESVTVTDAGLYEVTVTDNVGCTSICNITVDAAEEILCAIEGPDMICVGSTDTFTAVGTGGATPYTYNWTGPNGLTATGADITVSDLGEYCVTITDANGCTTECCKTLSFFEELTCAINGPETICEGETADYSVSLSNGETPVSYNWTGPNGFASAEATITVGDAGTYNVTVTDQNGCTSTCNLTLGFFAEITCDIEGPDMICAGDTGNYTAVGGGGTPPFTFSWTGPNGFTASGENITISDAGEYTVEITDANGCSTTCSKTLSFFEEITCAIDGQNIVCLGDAATFTALGTGGTSPLSYSWSGPNGFTASDAVITVTDIGAYCVTITDANGCNTECCQTLSVFAEVSCTIDGPETICVGETANYSVTLSNGQAPATYNWTGPNGFTSTDANISVGDAGTYSVTVTDQNGCTSTCSLTLGFFAEITCDIDGPDEICAGDVANFSAVVSGGTAPFTFNWSSPGGFTATEQNINITDAGEYTVVITDANGCSNTCSKTLSFFAEITCNIEGPDMICMGDAATFTAIGTGGTPPLSYGWTGPGGFSATGAGINISTVGEYSVTISDANGCSTTCSKTLSFFDDIACVIDGPDAICAGVTATYTVTLANGEPISSYSWTGPNGFTSTNAGISVTDEGEYSVTVTDANGCTTTCTKTLSFTSDIVCTVEGPEMICMGDAAVYSAAVPGGQAPFTYSWIGPNGFTSTDEAINISDAGEYCVTIIDANGCSTSCCQTLSFFEEITCSVDGPDTICPNGEITAVAEGGTAPYTYDWTGPNGFSASGASVNISASGEYCVTITDANGCSTNCCKTFEVREEIGCNIDGTDDPICKGETTTYTVSATGGVEPYTFAWSGPNNFTATTAGIDIGNAGEYCVTITDANGCTTTCCKTLEVTDIVVNLSADPTVILLGGSSILTANASGCDNCRYDWYLFDDLIIEDGGAILEVTPEAPVPQDSLYEYRVVVSEDGQCPVEARVNVRVRTLCDDLHVYIPNSFTPNGDGLNDELRIYSSFLEELKSMELMIYNRWGQEVFRTTNPAGFWDGTFKNEPLPPDVYGFYLEVVCPTDQTLVQKGDITLLR